MQGPIGPQGPKGNKGPEGPHGAQGLQGDKGVRGNEGIKGDKGVAGPPGVPCRGGIQNDQPHQIFDRGSLRAIYQDILSISEKLENIKLLQSKHNHDRQSDHLDVQ